MVYGIVIPTLPTMYKAHKAYLSERCKGISSENVAKHMVLTYLHFFGPWRFPIDVMSFFPGMRMGTSGSFFWGWLPGLRPFFVMGKDIDGVFFLPIFSWKTVHEFWVPDGPGFPGDSCTWHALVKPIRSMYGIFSYIFPRRVPHVGKYSMHGAYPRCSMYGIFTNRGPIKSPKCR